jgi:tol-pal system protein YbgF
VTPSSSLIRLSAFFLCLSLFGATAARAFDLNPFDRGPPPTAQGTAPPGAIPDASPLADASDPGAIDVRVDRLENELRQANGRIEELENQQRLLLEALKRLQQDVEYRLGGAGPAPAPGAPLPAAAAPQTAAPLTAAAPAAAAAPLAAADAKPRKTDAFDPAANPGALGAPRPLGTTPPSAPLAANATPTGAPLNLGDKPVVAPAATAPAAAPLPGGPLAANAGPTVVASGVDFTDGPRLQFNAALDAYRAGQYAQAEEQLKAFLAANGAHRLAPDAVFYLGETYFQRSRPREAAEQYLKLSTDYGKSPRAPEGMLRLGQALAALGNSDQACATFAEVGKRYPTAAPAVKKSAEREMQKDHC